jgi:hypothetical protein
MNAAISIIEKLSNDFQGTWPQFAETNTESMHPKLINYIYQGYCNQQESSTFIDVEDSQDDPFAFKHDGQVLRSSTVMCTHTTDLPHSYFSNPADKNLRLSADERRLVKCLAQLGSVSFLSAEEGMPTKGDLVHKAVWNMATNGRSETWQKFAVQILWDTQRELGKMLPAGKQLLEKTSKELVAKYRIYLGTEGLDKVGERHKVNRGNMEARVRYLEEWAVDSHFQPWFDKCEKAGPWKFDDVPGFSLLRCHPGLCGLILLSIRDDYHRVSADSAGSQGQIVVAAHLYNAAPCSGLLPEAARWTDLEWFIDQQGSEWIFVGNKPKEGGEFVRHLSLAMGLGVSKFAKDFRNPKTGNGSDGRFKVVGLIRLLEYLARFSELSVERHGSKVKKLSGTSRAFKDPATMADMLARDFLRPEKAHTALSSLDTLSAVKRAIDKDEAAVNFDVLDLYLRCIRLLSAIQNHCLKHAPYVFHKSIFENGLGMNAVVNELVSLLPLHHNPMFSYAVNMLREVIEEEGSVVLDNAEAQQ